MNRYCYDIEVVLGGIGKYWVVNRLAPTRECSFRRYSHST